MAALGSDLPSDLDFDCPRCGTVVRERVYGPCADCRAQLDRQFAGHAREVRAEAYVPKMNVTPNAVSSKDS